MCQTRHIKREGEIKMNIIYFGFDLFSPCLEYLCSLKDVNILKVYSFESDGYFDFNDDVKRLADKNNIAFTTEKITAEELKKQFEENNCDLIVSAGYQYRIPVEAVENCTGINIHPSLLPNLRGPWPIPWIILKGMKESGVTIHKLSAKFDEGDILIQGKFEVCENDNYFSLEEKIKNKAIALFKEFFSNRSFYYKNAKEQGKGVYLPEPSDFERTVFSDTSQERKKLLIRAFSKEYLIYSDKNESEGKKICH